MHSDFAGTQRQTVQLLLRGAFSILLQKASENLRMSMDLKSLFKDVPCLTFKGDAKHRVTGISTDSRRVVPGTVFVAIRGTRVDGNDFVDEAINRGAIAIVTEEAGRQFGKQVFIQVADARIALAGLARKFYGSPEESLQIAGITGTNGKTTVSYLVRYLLQKPEDDVGMIGTIEYALGNRSLPAFRTTPESIDIYAMLAQMRNGGCHRAVMEVSSHGIDQHRISGVPYKVAAFLNLTQDHIDYHHDMESYFEVKSRFFTGQTGKLPGVAVVNMDDAYGARLLGMIPESVKTVSFGENEGADLRATNLKLTASGTRFCLCWQGETMAVESNLLGSYNVSNVLAALAIGHAMGADIPEMVRKLPNFTGVPGRMERIDRGQSFNVLVDYAHTDDALKNALAMLRNITPGRLLVVFGCGGNRDRGKRPMMAHAVQEGSDFAWATADNPRRESIDDIFKDMKTGISKPDKTTFVADRRRAIALAIEEARPGDCVLIAGKGHETFQEFADTVAPFDDRTVAREILDRQRELGTSR